MNSSIYTPFFSQAKKKIPNQSNNFQKPDGKDNPNERKGGPARCPHHDQKPHTVCLLSTVCAKAFYNIFGHVACSIFFQLAISNLQFADQHGAGELRSLLKRTTLLPSLQGSVPLPSTYPQMALYARMREMKNKHCSCDYRTCILIFARIVPWQVVSIFILVIVGILYAHLSSQASRKIAARKLKSSMPWLKNG